MGERERLAYREAVRELAAARKTAECLTSRAAKAEKVLGGAGRGQRGDGLITEESNRNRLIFIGQRQVAFARLRNCCTFKTDRPAGIPDHNMDSREIQAARASAECLEKRAAEIERLIHELEEYASEPQESRLGDLYNSIRWMHECCPFTTGMAIGFPPTVPP